MSNKQFVGLRRSDSPELVPQDENIELGELAFNTADGKIYFKMLDGTVVELTDKFTKEEVLEIANDLFNETYSTPEQIKQAYESNADTNAFTNQDKSKLDSVKSMANRDVFIENSAPSSSDGNDGDVWFQF